MEEWDTFHGQKIDKINYKNKLNQQDKELKHQHLTVKVSWTW